MNYKNVHWGFELVLPISWHEPGLLKRIFFFFRYSQQNINPEFYGPNQSSLKIAIGPIHPKPSLKNQQNNLSNLAMKYNHEIIEIGQINVCDMEHATMTCRIPYVGVVKNYSLIFSNIEYFITAQGDLHECDSIVRSFQRQSP